MVILSILYREEYFLKKKNTIIGLGKRYGINRKNETNMPGIVSGKKQ